MEALDSSVPNLPDLQTGEGAIDNPAISSTLFYEFPLASTRRFRCGSVRSWPVLSSHFCLGAAPHVGQRTASICFGLSSFFITNSHCQKSDLLTNGWKPHGKPHIGRRSLPFRGDGHGPTLQKSTDKCAIYLQAAVVADEAFLLKCTHKFTYP